MGNVDKTIQRKKKMKICEDIKMQNKIEEIAKIIFDYVDSKGLIKVYILGNRTAKEMRTYTHNQGIAETLYYAGYRMKGEVLKDFAEKLKEKASNNCFLGGHCQEVVHIDDIDEILKEFL